MIFFFRTYAEFEPQMDRPPLYNEDGWVKPIKLYDQAPIKSPKRLVWDFPEKLEAKIFQAVQFNVKV